VGPFVNLAVIAIALGLILALILVARRHKGRAERISRCVDALNRLSRQLRVSPDLDRALQDVAATADDLYLPHALTIHEWLPADKAFVLRLAHRFPPSLAQQFEQIAVGPEGEAMSHALETRQIVIVSDQGAEGSPSLPPAALAEGFQDLWVVPILSSEQAIGTLGLWFKNRASPSQDDLSFLIALAGQVCTILGRNQQRIKELALLSDIAALSSGDLDIKALIQRSADIIEHTLNPELFEVMLVRGAGEPLEVVAARGELAHRLTGLSARSDQGIIGWVLAYGAPVLSPDVSQDPRYREAIPEIRSELCVPLKVNGEVIGLINADSTRVGAFTESDRHFLITLAGHFATVIENRRLVRKDAKLAEQLQIINEIGQHVAAVMKVDELLHHVVTILKTRFGHYDVNILLLDERASELVWRAGTKLGECASESSLRCRVGEGIVGWAAKHRQPLLVNDVRQEPRYNPVPELPDTQAEMAVPITLGERVLGVLDVQSAQAGAYGEEDLFVLQALARQLAIALDNARLLEQAQQRVSELTALRQVSLQLISTMDIPTVLETIAESALRLVGASDIHIYLYDDQTGEFTFGTALWDTGDRQPAVSAPRKDGLTALVAREARPIAIDDAAHHPLFSDGEASSWEIAAIAGFPLKRGARVLGVFNIAFREPHTFSEDELRALSLLADQTALGIERAQLFEELNRRVNQLSIMRRIGQMITATLNTSEILAAILRLVSRTLAAESASVFIPENGRLLCRGTIGDGAGAPALPSPHSTQSIAEWVWREKKPLLAPDIVQDPRFYPDASAKSGASRSILCTPLLSKGEVLGVVELVNRQDGLPFDQDDLSLLTAIAASTTAAIENAHLYEETERRLAEASALYNMAQQTTSSLAFDEVLDAIVVQLRTVISCRAICLFLLDESTQELSIAAATGLKPEFRDSTRLKIGEGISGQVFKKVRPIYVRDIPREAPDLGSDPSIRSLLVVPLIAKSKVIGTLSVDSTEVAAFTADHERLLTIAAAQAASAIENARLFAAERQRAEELKRAYEELQELDRLKSQFVQNVSHELRTPLTFVKGYADLLLEEAMGPLTERQRQSLTTVSQKTDSIIRLVNDIITLQEVECLPRTKSVTSLQAILNMVAATAHAAAENAGIELKAEIPDEHMLILADDDRLAQVFDNLVHNAIKFSPDGGCITISAQDADTCWLVTVQDSGIGIPSDKLEKVFERFYQVDGSTTRRFGGTGLGLAIAREIVTNHDGKIWAESTLGEGSTFFVSLPKCDSGEGE